MTNELLDPLAHNAWATKQLLAFCEPLTPDQLEATTVGTYGSILATFQHIVGADSRYAYRVAGGEPPWSQSPEETTDLAELSRMVDDLDALWTRLASEPFDPDAWIQGVDRETGERWQLKAGVQVAQALNHANEHRAQIFTILTTIGIQPPDLDGWTYGEATGRFMMLPG